MRTVEDLVRQEVIVCVSALVSTLASGYGGPVSGPLGELCEKAADLFLPVDDPDEEDDYSDAREIFEHWAVTEWLAEKLEAKGERVDRDFEGLCIWGRTTSG